MLKGKVEREDVIVPLSSVGVLFSIKSIEVPKQYEECSFYSSSASLTFSNGEQVTKAVEIAVEKERRGISNRVIAKALFLICDEELSKEMLLGAEVEISEEMHRKDRSDILDRYHSKGSSKPVGPHLGR